VADGQSARASERRQSSIIIQSTADHRSASGADRRTGSAPAPVRGGRIQTSSRKTDVPGFFVQFSRVLTDICISAHLSKPSVRQ
jgi:hypothetical protein